MDVKPTMAPADKWHLQPEIEARIRREALEEAAKVAEQMWLGAYGDDTDAGALHECMDRIRKLIDQAPS
jgi:hypothetical protein